MSDSTLFLIAGALAWFITIAHAVRFAHVCRNIGWPARVLSLGMSMVLATLATGLISRARLQDEFYWFHWLILVAVAFTTAGYVGVLISEKRQRGRDHTALTRAADEIDAYLAEMGHAEPCETPSCVEFRARGAKLRERVGDLRP